MLNLSGIKNPKVVLRIILLFISKRVNREKVKKDKEPSVYID